MTRRRPVIFLALCPLIVLGCNQPTLHKVHEAPLLDNKVLQQRVEAALHHAGPNFTNVQVKATSGTVLLTGTVPSSHLRARAEQIAQGVYGVHKITNSLQLNPHASSP